MATPNLNRIVLDLALKLRDVVTDAKSEGKIFTSEQRLRYIRNAFIRLRRKIKQVSPSMFNIYFPNVNKYILLETTEVNGAVKITLKEAIEDILDIGKQSTITPVLLEKIAINLSTIFGDNTANGVNTIQSIFGYFQGEGTTFSYKIISSFDAENYFKAIFSGTSDFYDRTKSQAFTIMDNQIIFAGKDVKVSKLKLFVNNYVPVFTIDGANDLIIASDIEDILVAEAALEASLDKGDNQSFVKAKYYSSFIANEIQLIKYKEEADKNKDKTTSVK